MSWGRGTRRCHLCCWAHQWRILPQLHKPSPSPWLVRPPLPNKLMWCGRNKLRCMQLEILTVCKDLTLTEILSSFSSSWFTYTLENGSISTKSNLWVSCWRRHIPWSKKDKNKLTWIHWNLRGDCQGRHCLSRIFPQCAHWRKSLDFRRGWILFVHQDPCLLPRLKVEVKKCCYPQLPLPSGICTAFSRKTKSG